MAGVTRALVIGFALLLALAGATALAPAQEPPLSGADATALLVRVTDERGLPLAGARADVTVASATTGGAFQESVDLPLSAEGEAVVLLPPGLTGAAHVSVFVRRVPTALAGRLGSSARSLAVAREIGAAAGGPVVLSLVTPSALTVLVVDARGAPVRDVDLRLHMAPPALARAGRTDALGKALFPGTVTALGPATLLVTDTRTDARVRRDIAIDGAPRTLRVTVPDAPRKGSLVVRIVDARGGPVAFRGALEIRREGRVVHHAPRPREGEGPLPGHGRRLQVDLSPGPYDVFIEGVGALLPAGTVTVTSEVITEARTLLPIAGAVVVRALPDAGLTEIALEAEIEHGAGGKKAMRPGTAVALVGLGRARVRATAPGRRPFEWTAVVASGATYAADIVMLPEDASPATTTAAPLAPAPEAVPVPEVATPSAASVAPTSTAASEAPAPPLETVMPALVRALVVDASGRPLLGARVMARRVREEAAPGSGAGVGAGAGAGVGAGASEGVGAGTQEAATEEVAAFGSARLQLRAGTWEVRGAAPEGAWGEAVRVTLGAFEEAAVVVAPGALLASEAAPKDQSR